MSVSAATASTERQSCEICAHLRAYGKTNTPGEIHCRHCHGSWSGVEAQHCVTCHRTFVNIRAADAHRGLVTDGRRKYRDGPCIAVEGVDGWREKRPGVWTNSREWTPPAA